MDELHEIYQGRIVAKVCKTCGKVLTIEKQFWCGEWEEIVTCPDSSCPESLIAPDDWEEQLNG